MENQNSQVKDVKKFGSLRRKPISLSQEKLVETGFLQAGAAIPLAIQPAVEGLNLVAWASSHRQLIEKHLSQHGAVLFRGFHVNSVADFERLIMAVSGELLEYTYRSTPRSQVSGRIYTSTEYPADQSIPLHNEMAYSRAWPMKISFCCLKAAAQGGETPIANSRMVFNRIDPKIKGRFMKKGVLYVRNYGHGLDLAWQDVFQTESKQVVEDFCRSAGLEFEWQDGNSLRTRQVCQAVATHPSTGETVWFNQAHLFHVSSLPPEVREALLSDSDEKDLPRNAYYGDGSPIEASVLDEIREIYEQQKVSFSWEEGDVLLLDNMLTAHGRAPFAGPRTVVVGMAEHFSSPDY
jgi:alpha-ketoglutarate-dependent taurine dioxygenase